MNKLKLLALLTVLSLTTHAKTQTPPVGTAHTINISWTYTPSTAWPACSSTVTTFCVKGFNAIITPPAGVTGTNTLNFCTSTITTNCITPGVSTTSTSWAPGGTLYTGTWNIQLWTVAVDGSGNLLPTCTTPTPACTQIVSTNVAYVITPTTTVTAPGGLTIQFN